VFTVDEPIAEYCITKYFYDQAGNLVQTVPPAGAAILTQYQLDQLEIINNNPLSTTTIIPDDKLESIYFYNTLNQVIKQITPDGGTTNFWYDNLGRIVASQNDKQLAASPDAFSYSIYDNLGRIIESGRRKLRQYYF
jgi:YD repeat-containing protein